MNNVTKDTLFKPNLSRTESRSRTTDEISRAITAEEKATRDRKTERLRAARLAKEAESPEQPVRDTTMRTRPGAKPRKI